MKFCMLPCALLALGVAMSDRPVAAQTDSYLFPDARVASNYNASYGSMTSHAGSCASCGGAGCASCAAGGCDSCGAGGCGGCWYAGGAGLAFSRDDDDDRLLSYDDYGYTVLSSRDAEFDYSGGFEVWAGRYFNGGRNAFEARYWGIYPQGTSATAWGSETFGQLWSFPRFDSLLIDGGNGLEPVVNFFDGAERHTVARSYQVHNIELNLLGMLGPGQLASARCGGYQDPYARNWNFTWLAGARFMRFDDGLLFASSPDDLTFVDENDMIYGSDVQNTLIGFQLGGVGYYRIGSRFTLHSGLKWGVFNNHLNHSQSVRSATGEVAIADGGPFDGQEYLIRSSKDDVSFLGELDLGASYCLTSRLSVVAGYRAIGVTGVGLSTNQYPRTFAINLEEASRINSNSSLILHGAYLGMSYNF